ncbi:MAG: (2Fe-2S)-binding protein [Planctomycetes bacterium]|nr:(2Fe-2S)-binding protein [Planctomycetota bacterium]
MSTDIIFHCYCTGVTQKRVLRAMAEQGVRSFEDIRRATGACTGCQSCRRELENLIVAVADGDVALPAPLARQG